MNLEVSTRRSIHVPYPERVRGTSFTKRQQWTRCVEFIDAFQHECQVATNLNWIINLILDKRVLFLCKQQRTEQCLHNIAVLCRLGSPTYPLFFVLRAACGLSGIGSSGRAGVISSAFTKPEVSVSSVWGMIMLKSARGRARRWDLWSSDVRSLSGWKQQEGDRRGRVDMLEDGIS